MRFSSVFAWVGLILRFLFAQRPPTPDQGGLDVQIGRLLFQKGQWDFCFAVVAARLEPVSISRAAPFGGSQTLHDVNRWPASSMSVLSSYDKASARARPVLFEKARAYAPKISIEEFIALRFENATLCVAGSGL
jgi:hypothetical protein